jgi:LytS/YehU family sensor histidine kinase
VKKKLLKVTLFLLPVAGFLYVTAYFLFWNVFPYIDFLLRSSGAKNNASKFWPAFNLGLIAPLKIIASAVVIKYVKSWWLKQKESEGLEREKINAELQLLKAQIHPGILFTSLNTIYDYAKTASPHAPKLLLKLSDMLSYMLYECDQTFVPLEKEIEMMKEYIAMEKLRRNDDIEMEVNVKDDLSGKMIAPFLLLPFIENSFKQSKKSAEQAWINMDIRTEGNHFSMKLANGISENIYDQPQPAANGLANVQKRLTLLYPGKHELIMTTEQEMSIVFLNIQLNNAFVNSIEEEKINFMRNEN